MVEIVAGQTRPAAPGKPSLDRGADPILLLHNPIAETTGAAKGQTQSGGTKSHTALLEEAFQEAALARERTGRLRTGASDLDSRHTSGLPRGR
jgi:hypothetical protein